jgi:hypothetical protein
MREVARRGMEAQAVAKKWDIGSDRMDSESKNVYDGVVCLAQTTSALFDGVHFSELVECGL